jgi:hypothetical protein
MMTKRCINEAISTSKDICFFHPSDCNIQLLNLWNYENNWWLNKILRIWVFFYQKKKYWNIPKELTIQSPKLMQLISTIYKYMFLCLMVGFYVITWFNFANKRHISWQKEKTKIISMIAFNSNFSMNGCLGLIFIHSVTLIIWQPPLYNKFFVDQSF